MFSFGLLSVRKWSVSWTRLMDICWYYLHLSFITSPPRISIFQRSRLRSADFKYSYPLSYYVHLINNKRMLQYQRKIEWVFRNNFLFLPSTYPLKHTCSYLIITHIKSHYQFLSYNIPKYYKSYSLFFCTRNV